MQTKKVINDGNRTVDEMLEGILAAHPRHLKSAEGSPRSIIARNGP
ncbi:MAG: dihydroxyacetone kinase, partial [Mesorhizobium sp.]